MTLGGWFRHLAEPVDAASLNVFRIGFGLILVVETGRFIVHDWIAAFYLAPAIHFKYLGFGWVTAWPGDGLYWHFAVMGLLAAMVAAGLLYRLAIVGFFLCFAFVFLLEQAAYLNQYYLVLLFAAILCALPAERGFSLEALLFRHAATSSAPRWSVWVLRLQVEIFLVFAGLVKLNSDWLQGQPLGMWLASYGDWPLVGAWLSEPSLALAASYAVVALHLVGAPLLLWRRTRLPVFLLYACFHLTSASFFNIGLFPWISLLATLMFFDPDWPRSVWRHLGGHVPVARPSDALVPAHATTGQRALATSFAVFFVVQTLVPLRHFLYPGDVAWTGEGRHFAWRMKLHDRSGTARFTVTDPATGSRWEVVPDTELSPRAAWMLPTEPDLILQFAHHLRERWARDREVRKAEVRVRSMVSLNGRPPTLLVDPSRDLSQEPRSWQHYDWILPLDEPLPKRVHHRRRETIRWAVLDKHSRLSLFGSSAGAHIEAAEGNA